MMKLFQPGMSQQHLLHEADLSAILISPSRLLVIKRIQADPARCAGLY
jgi:hypothetical protein